MRFIKDEEFIRGSCPMTKEVIRMLDICKMEIEEKSKVLDIGAGTGSISIQCAKICNKGLVVAIEKDDDAIDIIHKNMDKFQLNNLKVITGDAVNVEDMIKEKFDSIFIGGSSGKLEKIIEIYSKKLSKDGTVVLNFITLENVYKALKILKKFNYDIDCEQIAVSKVIGSTYMLKANNPIFIIKAKCKS